jgi:hypothetical protein
MNVTHKPDGTLRSLPIYGVLKHFRQGKPHMDAVANAAELAANTLLETPDLTLALRHMLSAQDNLARSELD